MLELALYHLSHSTHPPTSLCQARSRVHAHRSPARKKEQASSDSRGTVSRVVRGNEVLRCVSTEAFLSPLTSNVARMPTPFTPGHTSPHSWPHRPTPSVTLPYPPQSHTLTPSHTPSSPITHPHPRSHTLTPSHTPSPSPVTPPHRRSHTLTPPVTLPHPRCNECIFEIQSLRAEQPLFQVV